MSIGNAHPTSMHCRKRECETKKAVFICIAALGSRIKLEWDFWIPTLVLGVAEFFLSFVEKVVLELGISHSLKWGNILIKKFFLSYQSLFHDCI